MEEGAFWPEDGESEDGGLFGLCVDDENAERPYDEEDFPPCGFFGETAEDGDNAGNVTGTEVPLEVVLRVLALLSPEDLARAELVCRRWRHTIGPASPHLTFLWRQVYERHLGTLTETETSQDDGEKGSKAKVGYKYSHKHADTQNLRSQCRSGAQTLKHFLKKEDVPGLLRWAIRLGYHVMLADLLDTKPKVLDTLLSCEPIRKEMRTSHYGSNKIEYVIESDLWPHPHEHPSLLAVHSGSLPTIDLIATHAGVVPYAITALAKKGSLEALEVLLGHFVNQVQGLHASDNPKQAKEERKKDTSEEDWEQLEKALNEGGLALSRLFMSAVEAGRIKLVKHLISQCPPFKRAGLLSFTNSRTFTPLLEAIHQGYKGIFFYLLPMVSDAELRRVASLAGQKNALTIAIENGDVEMVVALLDRGLSANGEDNKHPLPLCIAISTRRGNATEMIKLLLKRGADINARQATSGKTVLHGACLWRFLNEELITFLLDQGADINALMKNSSVIGSLLSKPLQPHQLWQEVIRTRVLMLLHERGAPLHLDQPSLISRVLVWLKDINRHPSVESSMYAKYEETVEKMLRLLISLGCDTRNDHPDMLNKLIVCSSPRIIQFAVAKLGFQVKDSLAHLLANVTLCEPILAANAAALLELGADPNVTIGEHRQPAIFAASAYGREIVSMLIRYGADIRRHDASGMSILHWYFSRSWWRIEVTQAKALIELGADKDARDREGRTIGELVVATSPMSHEVLSRKVLRIFDEMGIPYPPLMSSEDAVDQLLNLVSSEV